MVERDEDIKTRDCQDTVRRLPFLKLLVIITDWDMARTVKEILVDDHALLFFQIMAHGTASSEMLDILGLGASDKALTLCLAPGLITLRLLADVADRLYMAAPGHGIGFALPVSSISKAAIMLLNEETLENLRQKIERDVEKMRIDASHDLIVSIINQGYSEELMEAAKEAGAAGGTVINARRAGSNIPARFMGLGLTIQEEKEMVLIIAEREKRHELMKAINIRCGLASEARGLVFSLPVDAVMGLS